MAAKRKLQADAHDEPDPKRYFQGYGPETEWMVDPKPPRGWRMMGNPAVRPSLPLSNMVSAVQDLLDPDFDPLIAILDDEPRFLKPLPSRIVAEDLEFLRFRGALTIPEGGLRTELLRCYVRWVHSFMPVLDLHEFLRCIAENDPNGNISQLLFQAVMFVGTAFVDLKHLQAAGYATRKIARNAFYTRVRLLYSFNCEEDRIVILQTVLLMTYWSDQENCPQRDIWDWIGICNTQAHSIGLNKDPAKSDLDVRTKRLRVRLWWSIYSRDRLIAMGMRRPTQINEGTSDVPMLRLDDFDLEPFAPSVLDMLRCRQLEDISHRKRLAIMFIEKVKLCQCIGRVLFAQYSPSHRQFGTTTSTTLTLIPRQASESELARCSQKLDSWLSGLPKDAQYIPSSKSNFTEGEEVLLLHGAMLRMLYHATSSALHRPWATGTANKDHSKSRLEWTTTARAKMQDAATGITHIVQGLNQLNLTRFLPQSGVTVILPAAVAHLANALSENPAVREASIYDFHKCIQVLNGLKDIYPAADIEAAHIEAAVRRQSDGSGLLSRLMFSELSSAIDMSQLQTSAQAPKQSSENNTLAMISYHEQEPSQERKSSPNGHQASTTQQGTTFEEFTNDQRTPSATFDPLALESPYSNDTLAINIDPFPDLSTAEQDISSGSPKFEMDWTEEFLDGPSPTAGLNYDFLPSSFKNHNHSFSFSPGRGEGLTTNNMDITGDLDRDLGFLQSSDDIFR